MTRPTILDEAEQLRLIADNLPAMSVAYDENLRCIFANQRFAEFFGFTTSSILGKHLSDIVGEKAFEEIEPYFDEVLSGTRTRYERTRVLDTGEERQLEVELIPYLDRSGRSKGLFAITADVTQRKRAEEMLRASEEKFSKAFHASPDWIALSKLHTGEFLEVNEGFERISGYTREESLGRTSGDLGIWPRPEQRTRLIEMLDRGEIVRDCDVVFRHRSGEERLVQVSMETIDLRGEACLLTVGRDITEARRKDQLRELEYAITELLSGAHGDIVVLRNVLRTICTTGRWRWGRYLRCAPGQSRLQVTDSWGLDEPSTPGTGGDAAFNAQLVEAAWHSGEAIWSSNDPRCPPAHSDARRPPACEGTDFLFPVKSDGTVIGVLHFHGREARAADQQLIQVSVGIGSQIGQFIQRARAEARVHQLAHFDELTGLPNRTTFNERLEHALARARRLRGRLAILFVDLDRFKNINDTLGHDAGDAVLEQLAQRMRAGLRETDLVSRLGGDEFLILVEDPCEPEVTSDLAQRLLHDLSRPVQVDSREFHLSASIGISTFPDDSDDARSLVRHADIAMYRAKERGRNNFQFYSAQMNLHTIERLTLESDLRRALERDEFVLHYQPRVAIDGARIVGMEALVRWQPPGKAQIPPERFIPLAEETGLIVPIGEWVMRTACRQNKAWQDRGLAHLRVAVNLSRRQFIHRSLLQDVARVLEETRLDPAYLEFEITESMVFGDPESAVNVLQALRDMGIHLSIDDFGTGHSSLAYLKRFPLDSLKIDRSFIQDLPDDADDAAITQAIIAMAHSLRLRVVAEGVETEEQLRFLRAHRCDEMQGYLISRPVPEHQFETLLQQTGPTRAARA